MKKIKLALGCLLAVAAVGCSSDEPSNGVDNKYEWIDLSRGEAEVANAGYEFAWNLFHKVNAENEGKNVCLSPLSANIALTMLLNGAEGQTRDEIIKTLGLEGMSVDEINENSRFLVSDLLNRDNGCKLDMANSLWMDEAMPIKIGFKATLEDCFDATARNTTAANFANDVNAWCSNQTNGMISKMLQPGESYSWALLNAVYFQNVWNKYVKFKDAGQRDFTNCDGTRVKTDFMLGKVPCMYDETEHARHAHIAFGNGAYQMSISLPNEGSSIEQCIVDLKNNDKPEPWLIRNIDLTMPEFEFGIEQVLNGALKSLGIVEAFDMNEAQFPNISDNQSNVNMVKQGCHIKVDEKGATAAAVTVVTGITDRLDKDELEPMVVDRPFIFTIYEQSTGYILFVGKIEKF